MKRFLALLLGVLFINSLAITGYAADAKAFVQESNTKISASMESETGEWSMKSGSLTRDVKATVISPHGLFYSDKELTQLLFSIPRGSEVVVLDSEVTETVAKISYGGFTGYIRKSNLSL